MNAFEMAQAQFNAVATNLKLDAAIAEYLHVEDAAAFQRFKSEVMKQARAAEEDGDLTPQKRAKIKERMRKADPEYAQFIEQQKQDREARIDAQFDSAEEEIPELAAQAGISAKDEKTIARLASTDHAGDRQ